ncbi:MAG: hypothetical protein ABIP77_04400 [Candidatus Limnocylindrales bacterium]
MTPKVVAMIEPVLAALGTEVDPPCWIAWGDDPGVRYMMLVPTTVGLVELHVRVNVPQEGPRVSGKLVRWNRVQVGELAIEMAGGHRLLTFQVESQVLKGADDDADMIAAFALELFAAIDSRVLASLAPARQSIATRGQAATSTRANEASKTARAARPSTPMRPTSVPRLQAPKER